VRTLSRLASALRIEDVLLTLSAAVLLPALDRWLGTAGATVSDDPTPLVGAVGLIAVIGVIGCLLTRGPEDSPPLADGGLTLQGWARFPLAAGVGIAADQTIPGLGVDPQGLVGLVFVATIAGALLHGRLPIVAVAWRRLMVLPMVLLAAGAFNQMVGDDLGRMILDFAGGAAPSSVVALWPLLLGAVGAAYVMLVMAPRAIADPGARGSDWVIRFLFLIASVLLSAALGLG
jgi:hypothetical protein